MSNLKTCSRCRKEKNIDEFRGENRQCNYCCDMRQQYRQNNPEKEKQWYKNYCDKEDGRIREEKKEYLKEYRQREELCEACNYYIKTCRKSKHVTTKTHIENLNKNKPIKIDLQNQYLLTGDYLCCDE